jgi:6-phosphogluconolactonase
MGKQPNLYSYPSVDDVAAHLRTYILQCQKAAFQRHDAFKIAVSGGSLPATLAKALLVPAENEDAESAPQFSKWHIFFADERAVPPEHEDSNYGLLKKDLLDKIPSEAGQPTVYPIDLDHLDNTQEIADSYQETLMATFANKDSVRLPIFDLILLGCGPDGHTCSLFPGHALLRETEAWVAAIEDSPKPPPRRITLTLPVVTHAHKIAFVATGSGKKDILRKILEADDEGRSLPCGLVNEGGAEKVSWFTDSAAVEGVSFPRRGSL